MRSLYHAKNQGFDLSLIVLRPTGPVLVPSVLVFGTDFLPVLSCRTEFHW